MKFSICIPNYNYARYLPRTLESVLSQVHEEFEVLVRRYSDDTATRENRGELGWMTRDLVVGTVLAESHE